MGYTIALDGPSGAGKSSLAKALAEQLGFLYLDTGALYRAIGLYGLRQGTNTKDPAQIVPLLDNVDLQLIRKNGVQHVLLNGEDVSDAIRTQSVSMAASDVSAIVQVRAYLLDLQRDTAKKENVVMDGRDIGTVVLPDADVKIFLTACVEVRAARRYKDLQARGMLAGLTLEQITEQIRERDLQDSTRAAAPLRQAQDAVLLDNSEMDFQQTVNDALTIVRSRIHV